MKRINKLLVKAKGLLPVNELEQVRALIECEYFSEETRQAFTNCKTIRECMSKVPTDELKRVLICFDEEQQHEPVIIYDDIEE